MTDYKWNNWDCTEYASEGVKVCTLVNTVECPFPYDPSNPQKFTWCAPPGAEQEEAPYGGDFYHTIIIHAPNTSEKVNDFSNNMILYSIIALILLSGIAIVVLIL